MCNAFAIDYITNVGISIPYTNYVLSDGFKEEQYLDNDLKGIGFQFKVDEHFVFDNNAVLSLNLNIGNTKVKSFYSMTVNGNQLSINCKTVNFNFDIGFGYAFINNKNFKLLSTVEFGVNVQKLKIDDTYTYKEPRTDLAIAFTPGIDVYGIYKFSNAFGVFMDCKVYYGIGQFIREWDRTKDIDKNITKGIVVKPSVGISLVF